MCEQCVKIDKKIEDYRRASRITDPPLQLVAEMEAQKLAFRGACDLGARARCQAVAFVFARRALECEVQSCISIVAETALPRPPRR